MAGPEEGLALDTASSGADNSGATAPGSHRLLPRPAAPCVGAGGLTVNLPEAALTARLTLICHATTPSMRAGGFPAPDEELDVAGVRAASALAPLSEAAVLLTSPAPAARATAAALGVATADEALRDQEHGAWAGLNFAEIPPEAFAGWLADPEAGAPGGEPLSAVVERLRPWLDARAAEGARVVAVTHPMVVRAALAVALDAPTGAIMRIDIAPLAHVRLSFNRIWRLQALVPGKSI